VAEVIAALGWREARDTLAQQRPERLDRPTARSAHERFEFGETEFDRIEVRTVRGQVPQRRPGGFDQLLDAVDVMRGEIVGDDHVARREGGDQDLFDVGEKTVAVHRAVDHPRRGQPGQTHAGDKGARLPARERCMIADAVAAQTAAVPAQEIRRDAGFIEKDEARRVPRRRCGLPLLPRGGDVGPVVFGRAHRLFLR
jgi:alpha-D-ribose 1-methylphosphonate 5-triphosphate synthase subunit PhnG